MAYKVSQDAAARTQMPVLDFDLADFVNAVADRFEKYTRGKSRVSPAAREELVQRMRPHELELRKDLFSAKMTVPELGKILFSVLQAAGVTRVPTKSRVGLRAYGKSKPARYAYRFSPIDRVRVQAAMKRKCKYLGWC